MDSNSQPGTPRRIFLVDDHPIFLEGLAQMINSEKDMTVCGTAKTAAEGLTGLERCQPDLAVLDITLPDKNGLEIIKQVRLTDRKVKLLVVSMHDEAVYANRVLRLGGDGYIMKQEDPGEIINAIRDVLAGHIYVSEEMMNQTGRTSPRPRPTKETSLLDQLADLELEVLELLGQGKSNEEIASQLVLPQEKIDLTCAEVKQKLNLNSDNALIRYAVCWVESGAV